MAIPVVLSGQIPYSVEAGIQVISGVQICATDFVNPINMHIDGIGYTSTYCGPKTLDSDNDGITDALDNCIFTFNPDQKDIDSLPPYDILDKILYQYIERTQGPDQIKEQGFDVALVDKVLKMVNTNEYKRNQFCPIIRISPKAFGVGRRMPIVGKYLS